jgi:hypothetical protein
VIFIQSIIWKWLFTPLKILKKWIFRKIIGKNCPRNYLPPLAAEFNIETRLCKKVFYGASRQKPFYTTPFQIIFLV